MPASLEKFKYRLPYASELFGVYQPILGWRSARTVKRVLSGLREQDASLFRAASLQIRAQATFNADHELESLNAGTIGDPSRGPYDSSIQSMLADAVYKRVQGRNLNDVEHWGTILAPDSLAKLYAEIQPALNAQFRQARLPQEARAKAFEAAAKRESVVGGLLSSLYINKQYVQLANLFSPPRPTAGLSAISLFFEQVADPLETLDPTTGLGNAGLSPVGLVHLFRQYFFEFETFLGPSVQHIWLSPGGTAELIEISTRKTTIERVVESSTETSRKSEKSSTQEDEISDAVKQDNENNTKFGASVSANERWVWGDANETATVEFGNTQKQAREETHKHMRQQTEKLSTEIKQNFKTTFRTITETQDTTSRRYVLQNNTGDLINYELRRKMRQVGVQVQDLGTQLCWQTYVDDPGRELGVAKLVHLAPPPDFSGLGPISELPLPDEYTEDIVGSFNLPPGEHTYAGWRQWMADIQLRPKDGFEYLGCGALRFLTGGSVDLKVVENRITAGQGEPIAPAPPCLSVYLTGGHSDRGGELMQFTIPIRFGPSASKVTEVQGRNSELLKARDVEKDRLTREAYVNAASARIKAASNIEPRRYDELREEERIVVYRSLLRMLMDVGVDMISDLRVLHKVSELLASMFDIDKMLYFVAPEWWRPRMHQSQQTLAPELGSDPQGSNVPTMAIAEAMNFTSSRKPSMLDGMVIGWGGTGDAARDNYYITEDSVPARLGSSLGWLLELDGDNLRNAFLNAPWVKAVIPIRPGKEVAALNWLTHAQVEGDAGLDDLYQASNAGERGTILGALKNYQWNDPQIDGRYVNLMPENLSVRDALRYVAVKVKEKHLQGLEKVSEDLGNGVELNYLPSDKVFEHGFYPLSGGFTAQAQEPYEIFDQWVEVLPTDQVVAVEVEYDAKTGKQL